MLSARCDNKSQMTGTVTKTFPGQLCGTQQLCTQTPAVQWHRGDGDPSISYARGGTNTPRLPLPPCPRSSLSSWGLRPWLQEAAQTQLCGLKCAHNSPYSHFVDNSDEDTTVLELGQIIEGIRTNLCAVHLEMGCNSQKAEAKTTLCCATYHLQSWQGTARLVWV